MNCSALRGARFVVSVLSLAAACAGQAQITLGQIDTFQTSGFVHFWNGGANPFQVENGGPNGAGDGYMQISSDGSGFTGGKCAVWNDAQWTGNYTSAGVKAVTLDLKNLGPNPLTMRLVLFGPLGSRWTSRDSVSVALPVGGGWTHCVYYIRESDFIRVAGTESWAAVSSSNAKLMIRHNSGAANANGTSVVATLGIDNVHAIDSFTVKPNNVTVSSGDPLLGTIASLFASDDDRFYVGNDFFTPNGIVEVSGQSVNATLTGIDVTVEHRTSRPNMVLALDLWDYPGNTYRVIGSDTPTTSDATKTVNITTNFQRFLSGSGEVKGRMRFIPTADLTAVDGWNSAIDLYQWNLKL